MNSKFDAKSKYLELSESKRILSVTIQRPESLNALSRDVLTELLKLFQSLKKNSFSYKGILLKGAGQKAFGTGADIKEMSEMDIQQGSQFASLGQKVTLAMEDCPLPIIACVDGFALGGGCELAMACDFIYSTSQSQFGQPEVNWGLIPCFGGCVRLFKLVGPGRAKELIYTGQLIESHEAQRIGLVNRVFESRDEMMVAAKETLNLISSKSPHAIEVCKATINACVGKTNSEGLRYEEKGFTKAFASLESVEGINAFLEKRQPVFGDSSF